MPQPAMQTTPDMDDLPNRNQTLKWALLVSLTVHAVLLMVRFTVPQLNAPDVPSLEVILVNSQSDSKPKTPDALAQVALDGGGNQEQGRAKSPLPSNQTAQQAPDFLDVEKRLAELEQQQKRLADNLEKKKAESSSRPIAGSLKPVQEQTPPSVQNKITDVKKDLNTEDLLTSAREIARLEAQISKQIDDYNKRPRKHFFSPSASPYSFAIYEEGWRQKVERFGNLNYPEEARGKIYGQLRMTVYIRSDGTLDDIEVDRSSGYPTLDRAAMRIVRMSAPYAKFTPDMSKQIDVLAISRTWVFTNDALETRGK